jgi:hypothetical protein
MSDRIEPIRREDAAREVPAVVPVARRDRDPQREGQRRERRREQPTKPVITRDDDGAPHVDIRA